ncbi:MAG: hypothetical protein ACTHN0_12570, partial [Aquihabitans sp.]
ARRGVGVPLPLGSILVTTGGAVADVATAVGRSLSPGNPILTTSDDEVRARCTLPLGAGAGVPPKARAVVSVGGVEVGGRVASVKPGDDDVAVRFVPDGPVSPSLAGRDGELAVTVAASKGTVLTVPATAIRLGRSGDEVEVIRKGRRIRVPVQAGLVAAGWVEIDGRHVRVSDRVVVATSTR